MGRVVPRMAKADGHLQRYLQSIRIAHLLAHQRLVGELVLQVRLARRVAALMPVAAHSAT